MTTLQIRLYRDCFSTPWGFRLQGGKDLGQALSIQRVFSNSPAEGELQRGDLILAIGGRNCSELTHKQALDLIKHGGGQIQLQVQRSAAGHPPSALNFKPQRPRAPSIQSPTSTVPSYGFQPKKITLSNYGGGGPDYGSNYAGGYRPSAVSQPVHVHTGPRGPAHSADMLNKVQESLDNISLSPRTPDYGYQPSSFSAHVSPGGHYIPTGVRLDMQQEEERRRQQHKPYVPTSEIIDQQMANKGFSPKAHAPAPWHKSVVDDNQSGPAWKSTLKATGVKPWDADLDYVPGQQHAPMHVSFQPGKSSAPYQPVPTPAPTYHGRDEQDGPKVVHLQYNSPMGLYSNENVQETYAGQTKAMVAAGALSPGGTQSHNSTNPFGRDWNQSAVYRMIHDDDGGRSQPTVHQPYQQPQNLQQHHHHRQPYQQPQPHQWASPASAYKPQGHYQQAFEPNVEEFGTSEF